MLDKTDIVKLQQKNCKICMDMILQFIHLIPEVETYEKMNMTTKDYTITQFISYLEKTIPKEYNTLYKLQAWIGQGIEDLDLKNNKGRKKNR